MNFFVGMMKNFAGMNERRGGGVLVDKKDFFLLVSKCDRFLFFWLISRGGLDAVGRRDY